MTLYAAHHDLFLNCLQTVCVSLPVTSTLLYWRVTVLTILKHWQVMDAHSICRVQRSCSLISAPVRVSFLLTHNVTAAHPVRHDRT